MRLSDFILSNMEAILHEWEQFAQSTSPGRHLDTRALRNDAEHILRQIAKEMNEPETREEQERKSKASVLSSAQSVDSIAVSHAKLRRSQGFNLNEMVAEYRALRASVIRLWTRDMASADADTLYELTRFNEAIDETWVAAIARYGEEIDRSRELLLGILGHDLRTPLSAIVMSAQSMLSFGDLGDRSARAARRILNSAEHIKDMISALLDVTRVRLGGTLPMEPQPSDLSEICREVVEEMRAAYPSRQIDLESNGDLHGTWDRGRLYQMLSNLLANALHHGAAERPVSLTASDSGDEVILRVHNEGEPIPPDIRHHIFDPTAPNKATSKTLGLGLSIVRAVAESHGGQISVESSEQEGTTFTVSLPRKPAE